MPACNHVLSCLFVGALAFAGCVTDDEPSPDGDGEDEQACLDACLAKGGSDDECTAWCTNPGDGKPGAGEKPPSGGVTADGGGREGDPGEMPDPGETLDPEVEKPCIQCWYDETETGGACNEEAKACEASLACTQLQWCPTLCGKPECFEECNAVIPTGVAPLTALAQCAVCNDGPCADACEDSVMRAYCD